MSEELKKAIKDYEQFAMSDDFNEDRIQKYEQEILERAIESELGKEWWDKFNTHTEKW